MKTNKQFANDIESGRLSVPEEYQQFIGKAKLVGMTCRSKIDSGLAPDKVREIARKELAVIGRDVAAMHAEKAAGFRERAANRRQEISDERKYHPDSALLRLREAELKMRALPESVRLHKAMQLASDAIGMSREDALVLASMVPENSPAASAIREYIERNRIDDPMEGDAEVRTMEQVAASTEALGESMIFTRLTEQGATERGSFALESIVDLGE